MPKNRRQMNQRMVDPLFETCSMMVLPALKASRRLGVRAWA